MTDDIKAKALAVVNEIRKERGLHKVSQCFRHKNVKDEALFRTIERHEAYKQEVSDAIRAEGAFPDGMRLCHFIIPKPKPDPLVEVLTALDVNNAPENVEEFRAALDALGFEIREKGSKNDA
jgi:hypothetical protein